ncbi:hypothetical protein KO495_13850 [Colwellia sp. D2M02]|uniref:hypothetical protein n=1 Tax=Colwellia sp. D2M02 TaxID=2841562 RepID=UPI001C0A13FC|nr:hypothetical protein [Colwellia sp. D2M02]MBU2894394.1 hypothetical protein [Colwellia sp. D2M02]
MKLIFIGLTLNVLFALFISTTRTEIGVVALIPCGISFIGCLLLLLKDSRWGLYTILVSSIVFIPLGAVACIGVKKELDKIKDKLFQAEFDRKIKL